MNILGGLAVNILGLVLFGGPLDHDHHKNKINEVENDRRTLKIENSDIEENIPTKVNFVLKSSNLLLVI